MNEFLEKLRNFLNGVFEKIRTFFRKTVERLNNCRIFLWNKIKNCFERLKLKKDEFLKNCEIKRNERNAANKIKKEEKLKVKQEREQKRQEEAEQRNVYLKTTGAKILRGFLNVFDVMFETLFACGIIFCIRPELLDFEGNFSCQDIYELNSIKIILFGSLSVVSEEVSNLTIFIIVCIFAAYLLYKIIFSLATANGVNKLISILLVVITLISVTLVKDKLLIFLALYVLLLVTFQFSCGFDFKVFRAKFIGFICLTFVSYVAVLFIFDEVFKNSAIILLNEMKLPIRWL